MADNPAAPSLTIVDRAGAEMTDWLIRFQETQQLTDLELMLVVSECQRRFVRNILGTEIKGR